MSKNEIDARIEYEAKLRGESDKIINIMKLINFAKGAVSGTSLQYLMFLCFHLH